MNAAVSPQNAIAHVPGPTLVEATQEPTDTTLNGLLRMTVLVARLVRPGIVPDLEMMMSAPELF